MSNYEKRQGYVESTLQNLISHLPSSYNKEVGDTNFYKLLRALSQEVADAEVAIDEVRDNIYLDSASGDAIYNNFGVFVKLQKRDEWSEDKYRALIQGVTKALLKGPNKQNLLEAFQLFTQFEVKVFELYKDKALVDPAIYAGYNPKYTFLLQIEKPLDSTIDTATLNEDANYLVNIIKPAHTIGIHIINLRGEENYREFYGVEKKISDLAKSIQDTKFETKLDEWVDQNLDSLIEKYVEDNQVDLDTATDAIYVQNYGKTKLEYEAAVQNKAQELYDKYIASFSNNPYNLNDNSNLIPVLDIEYFEKLAIAQLRGTIDAEFLSQMREQAYSSSISGLTSTQLNRIITAKKQELIKIYINNHLDPNDYTDAQWRQKAIDALKDEAYANKVYDALGGLFDLFDECFKEAEQYRDDFESNYTNFSNYYGMDRITVETNRNNRESTFGWKSLTYQGQLYTSISFDQSKIGGTDLIGPRYVLGDVDRTTLETNFSENFKPTQGIRFILNSTKTLEGSLVLPEMDYVYPPDLGYTEEKFKTPTDQYSVLQPDVFFTEKYDNFDNKSMQLNNVNSPLSNPDYPLSVSSAEDRILLDSVEINGLSETLNLKTKISDQSTNGYALDETINTKAILDEYTPFNYDFDSVENVALITKVNEANASELNGVYTENINITTMFGFRLNDAASLMNLPANTMTGIRSIDNETNFEYQQAHSETFATPTELGVPDLLREETFLFTQNRGAMKLNIGQLGLLKTAGDMDSGDGKLFRVDGQGVETVVEQRAI